MVASFTIEGGDNSFAVASGSNVGIDPGYSRFDHPPNSTSNLQITTNDGDPDPRVFEVGDTYDVTWSGHGGGNLEDAVVVRSDPAPGGGGIVVFEGTSGGETVHVIWTPDFDLENWYWTNYGPSNPPNFYTTDQDPAYDHEYICFERSTQIATPRGYIRAGQLKVGETVCTLGGVAREILWIGQKTVSGRGAAAPVRFPKGAIGNFAPIKLSPQHRVLISSHEADLHFGEREILVPAISLVDGKRIRQVEKDQVTYVHILLDRHDILLAQGAPCESLLPSEIVDNLIDAKDRAAIKDVVGDRKYHLIRPSLHRREAELIAANREPIQREAMFL